MMAPAIVAIPIFFLFRSLGLLDTVWALMLIYAAMNLSVVTWIIRSYMLDIPQGDRGRRAHRRGGRPAHPLGDHHPDLPAGHHHRGGDRGDLRDQRVSLHAAHRLDQQGLYLSVALANFTGGSDGVIYNAIALVAFLAFLPIFVLVILIQKHLSRGLTMGAVKG